VLCTSAGCSVLEPRTRRAYPKHTRIVGDELAERFDIRVETISIDLASEGAATEIARFAVEHELNVELLVNNAASGDHGEFSSLSPESQSKVITLNTLTLVELTRRLLPPMIAARRGAIVNVSSTAGFQPMPYFAVYAATKAFVTSFSLALAEEVRGAGVRVVTLCPGPTRAPSHENIVSKSRIAFARQPAEEVVEAALSEAEAKGGLLVPRVVNKAMVFSNRLMPLWLSARLSGRAMRPRDP
jgi:Short-chain dehydrogenases of various substrate specificities